MLKNTVTMLSTVSSKISFLLAALIVLTSCAHKPPEGAVAGRISVVSVNNTPYQSSWIHHYVPKGVNDYAYYSIVDGRDDAPYKLNVDILSINSNVSGFSQSYSGTKVNYRARIEYHAELVNQDGSVVWSWTGWAEHNSESNAIYTMAKIIGREMGRAGLLKPSYYAVVSQ